MPDLFPRARVKAPAQEPEPWVDIHQAAAHLGVKATWLYARGDLLSIPCSRIGRIRRYRLSELDAYMKAAAA